MALLKNWRYFLASFMMSRGKDRFIKSLPAGAKVLDVGCGNNSPERVKVQRPDIHYVGIDIADYNQDQYSLRYADEYITANSSDFSQTIASRKAQFDAVISSHNLEHCEHPWDVLTAMLESIKGGGRLYLAFPSEQSVHFPSRRGTLNFFDDASHRFLPPFDAVTGFIEAKGFFIHTVSKRYRPPLLFLAGLLLEPVGFLTGKNMPFGSTWALYGFESVIWASKKDAV